MRSSEEYEVQPYIRHRRVVADMVELTATKHQMKGGMEINVTLAREKLRQYKAETGASLSFTAWFVKCAAEAVAENRAVHGMRRGRKVILFSEVDVLVMMETTLEGHSVALPYVVRSADKKNLVNIHAEIRAAQKNGSGSSEMIGGRSRLMDFYPHIPKALRMLIGHIASANPFYVKANTGTVSVSAVGMMGRMNGWISPISPLPVSFAVCGITEKPSAVDGSIEIREMLSVAFTVNHDIVDGAQVVRFLSRLTELMEAGFGLDLPKTPSSK